MKGTMASFEIRVEREGNENKVQLIIHGDTIAAETPLKPIDPFGTPLYLELFAHTLSAIKAD